MTAPFLGVIGGSGLYQIDGLASTRWVEVKSPFGKPSDAILTGELEGLKVAFLPRHGRGHRHSPSTINYRANIDALKRLGVTDVLSVSAVGSLKESLHPGDFLLVDQFIDRTFAREKSFFGEGLVAHVSMAHPVCGRLANLVAGADSRIARGGTYVVMEGPQFSTKAESELYRSWGASVIGMTNMPEAKLAREAELCYATIAMVTDYDCWHPDHDHVSVDAVVKVLHANADRARGLIKSVVAALPKARTTCPQGCDHALEYALITAPEARDPKLVEKLGAVAGRVLKQSG
ncbi:MAG: S-methyl-5'-thioadenosine phosphorylase [Alphaproteobacteria bacterium]|nr:S-methyl-5'-thioadenosine phosphorylase [Alphaproteobacteria bacterium]